MNFVYLNYLPVALILFLIFSIYIIKYEKNFFSWVEKHWFFKRSFRSKLSTLFYLAGFLLLITSLLDLRGPELKINANIPDQKTIILIDSSASMLVEDVRPNRFEKSLMMARHFVKMAIGHQTAVVLFSDIQKRLIPFTSDIDLLDSRIAALSRTDIRYGGSNITKAIYESIQYFKSSSTVGEEIIGNLIVFTDSEESEGKGVMDLTIPDGVNVAMVGVGTEKGGAIPLRNDRGVFQGNKQYGGQEVVSKLDVKFLRKFAEKVKNYKYWLIASYSIPTEEILSFFRMIHKKRTSKGEVRIRPVLAEYLVVPGIVFLLLGLLLRFGRPYVIPLTVALVFCLQFNGTSFANELNGHVLEVPAKLKELTKIPRGFESMKNGEFSKEQKLKMAQKLLEIGRDKESLILYEENISKLFLYEEDFLVIFNYATALLKTGDTNKGIVILKTLQESVDSIQGSEQPDKQKIKQALRNNILLSLQQKEKEKEKEQQNNKKDQKKKKEKQEKKGKKQDQEEKQKQKGKNQSDRKEKKEEKKQKQEKKRPQADKDKKREKEKDQNRPQTLEEKEEMIKEKKEKIKIPVLLKQLMHNDRRLQQRYFETTKQKKGRTRDKKDW